MATSKPVATSTGKPFTAKEKSLLTRRAKAAEAMHRARSNYYLTRAELSRLEQEMMSAGLTGSMVGSVAHHCW